MALHPPSGMAEIRKCVSVSDRSPHSGHRGPGSAGPRSCPQDSAQEMESSGRTHAFGFQLESGKCLIQTALRCFLFKKDFTEVNASINYLCNISQNWGVVCGVDWRHSHSLRTNNHSQRTESTDWGPNAQCHINYWAFPPPFLESNHPLSSFPVQFWCFCRNQQLPTAKKSQPQKCKAQAYPVELSIWESTSTGGLCSWTEVRHGWAWRITVVGNLLTIVRLTRQLEGETNQMTTALRSSRISNLKKKGAFLLI